MARLVDIKVDEVSLVDKAANKKKFLFAKREGGVNLELLKKLKESEGAVEALKTVNDGLAKFASVLEDLSKKEDLTEDDKKLITEKREEFEELNKDVNAQFDELFLGKQGDSADEEEEDPKKQEDEEEEEQDEAAKKKAAEEAEAKAKAEAKKEVHEDEDGEDGEEETGKKKEKKDEEVAKSDDSDESASPDESDADDELDEEDMAIVTEITKSVSETGKDIKEIVDNS